MEDHDPLKVGARGQYPVAALSYLLQVCTRYDPFNIWPTTSL